MAGPIECWTPGRIIEHLTKGWIVPADWRERLIAAGYSVPDDEKAAD